MKTIYLDRQIIIDGYEKKDDVLEAITICKNAGYIFPYSPAHVEEIVKSHALGTCDDIAEQLEFLSSLSDNYAFMPMQNSNTDLRIENIYDCQTRVADNGGRELTEIVNQIELSKLDNKNVELAKNKKLWNTVRTRTQKRTWDTVFLDEAILSYLNLLAVKNGFRIRTSTFQEKENTIEILFNVLDLFGFKKDESKKRIENRIHDISHLIYASSANIFVTNDDKLNNKAKAILHFLKIHTLILNRKEFVESSKTLHKEDA